MQKAPPGNVWRNFSLFYYGRGSSETSFSRAKSAFMNITTETACSPAGSKNTVRCLFSRKSIVGRLLSVRPHSGSEQQATLMLWGGDLRGNAEQRRRTTCPSARMSCGKLAGWLGKMVEVKSEYILSVDFFAA